MILPLEENNRVFLHKLLGKLHKCPLNFELSHFGTKILKCVIMFLNFGLCVKDKILTSVKYFLTEIIKWIAHYHLIKDSFIIPLNKF